MLCQRSNDEFLRYSFSGSHTRLHTRNESKQTVCGAYNMKLLCRDKTMTSVSDAFCIGHMLATTRKMNKRITGKRMVRGWYSDGHCLVEKRSYIGFCDMVHRFILLLTSKGACLAPTMSLSNVTYKRSQNNALVSMINKRRLRRLIWSKKFLFDKSSSRRNASFKQSRHEECPCRSV